MTAQTDLDLAASQILEVVQGFNAVFRGGPTQTVNNGTELLPSISKLIADSQARVNAELALTGRNPRTITPSDTAILTPPLNGGLFFPNGGTVALEYANGLTESYQFAPQSYWPMNPVRVLATGTDPGIAITGYSA